MAVLFGLATGPVRAIVPQYTVGADGVRLAGVDADNPIIYDNDWWTDVFDAYYIWAQASLGRANLRGNIVSRDMWDHPAYKYTTERCVQDARKAIELARRSGLRNIPDLILGSDRVLDPPASGRIEDTIPYPSDGSRLIVQEARKASAEKPLVIVVGGPLTTVANALLTNPEIGPNIVVFGLTVSYYGYNGKDGWSAYIVSQRARLVEWATRSFWDRNSVFRAEHFDSLPRNPLCEEMQRFIRTDLGQANQLGDGAPLVWMFHNPCWRGARVRKAVWRGKATDFVEVKNGEVGDVLDIPKDQTDLGACREEFFRVMSNPQVFGTKVK